jgi:hypothetical protein
MPCPPLSGLDEWENWLVYEAVFERFHAMRRIDEDRRERRDAAKRKAQEIRDKLKLERGGYTSDGG